MWCLLRKRWLDLVPAFLVLVCSLTQLIGHPFPGWRSIMLFCCGLLMGRSFYNLVQSHRRRSKIMDQLRVVDAMLALSDEEIAERFHE